MCRQTLEYLYLTVHQGFTILVYILIHYANYINLTIFCQYVKSLKTAVLSDSFPEAIGNQTNLHAKQDYLR